MAKCSVDDILKETLPHKSKEDYLKAWKQFKEYIGEDRRPNEEDYIQYLKAKSRFARSTKQFLGYTPSSWGL